MYQSHRLSICVFVKASYNACRLSSLVYLKGWLCISHIGFQFVCLLICDRGKPSVITKWQVQLSLLTESGWTHLSFLNREASSIKYLYQTSCKGVSSSSDLTWVYQSNCSEMPLKLQRHFARTSEILKYHLKSLLNESDKEIHTLSQS